MADRYDTHNLHIALPDASGVAEWLMKVEKGVISQVNLKVPENANLSSDDIALLNAGYQELVAIAAANGYTEPE